MSKKFILCFDENRDDANLFGIWLTLQDYEVKATNLDELDFVIQELID